MPGKILTAELDNQIIKLFSSKTQAGVKSVINKLASISDILDRAGKEKDADYVDQLLKEAQAVAGAVDASAPLLDSTTLQFLSGAGIGEAVNLFKAFTSGKSVGEMFSKEGLISGIKSALIGAGANLISNALLSEMQNVPVLSIFLKSETIRKVISGIVAGALVNSNFVEHLVDDIIEKVESVFSGFKSKDTA